MTVNIIWRDSKNRCYVVTDSAATYFKPPANQHSLLGHSQRTSKGETVEEGWRKIVDVGGGFLAFAGLESTAAAFANAVTMEVRNRLKGGASDGTAFQAVVKALAKDEEFSAVLMTGESTYVLRHPEMQLVEMDPDTIWHEGSIEGSQDGVAAIGLIRSGIRHVLNMRPLPSADEILVAGLAAATLAAVQYELTEVNVGGAFYGARVEPGTHKWQPDILYVLYDPIPLDVQTFPTSAAAFRYKNAKEPGLLELVSCRVRDGIPFGASTIGNRGVVSVGIGASAHEVEQWSRKWRRRFEAAPYDRCQFAVLVPTSSYGAVLIARIGGQSVRVRKGRVLLSDVARSAMAGAPDDKFAISFLP